MFIIVIAILIQDIMTQYLTQDSSNLVTTIIPFLFDICHLSESIYVLQACMLWVK